jgi:uncharacterized membrane protein required for colicin V production
VIFDIIIAILLLVATIGGWRSGAIAMLLALVVLVLAGMGASALAAPVGHTLKIGPMWARPVIGFIITFIVLVFLGGWIRRAFSPKRGILRGFDGIAGAILGFLRAAFILGILLALFALIHLPPERTTEKSVLYQPLLKTSAVAVGVLKPYIHASVANERDSI